MYVEVVVSREGLQLVVDLFLEGKINQFSVTDHQWGTHQITHCRVRIVTNVQETATKNKEVMEKLAPHFHEPELLPEGRSLSTLKT